MKQKILAVSGVKNSGKTTLLEKMIPLLDGRGIRCAVIKHDGHVFDADREGTDTARMLGAGAFGAAIFDGEKFQAVKRKTVSEQELIAMYPEADLILLEGFKYSAYPKLEIVRSKVSRSLSCDPGTLVALVTDCEGIGPEGVPVFLPDDAEKIAAYVADWLLGEAAAQPRVW